MRLGPVAIPLIVFFLSCSADESPEKLHETRGGPVPDSNSYQTGTIPLTAKTFYRSDELSVPSQVLPVDRRLYVLNLYSAPYLHVLDRETGQLICALGGSGGGPDEFKYPESVTADDSFIWVGDPNQGRITEYSANSICAPKERNPRTIAVPLSSFIDVRRLPKNVFLAHDVSGLHLFMIINNDGGILKRFGPSADTSRAPRAVAGNVNRVDMSLAPGDSLIITAGIRTGAISIYDMEGKLRDTMVTPIRLTPSFRVGTSRPEPSMVMNSDMRTGYVGMAAGKKCLLALFSGRSLGDYGFESGAGTDLHVFDWDGTFLKVYRLNHSIGSLAVDWTSGTLYGSHWEEDPSILSVTLPDDVCQPPAGS